MKLITPRWANLGGEHTGSWQRFLLYPARILNSQTVRPHLAPNLQAGSFTLICVHVGAVEEIEDDVLPEVRVPGPLYTWWKKGPAVLLAHLKPRQDPAKKETGNFCLTSPVNKVYKAPH